MACDRCGFRSPPNPLGVLLASVNQWVMIIFLDHMTPTKDAALGVADFYINWYWLMWRFLAIGGSLSAIFFLLCLGFWLSDPEGYHTSWVNR